MLGDPRNAGFTDLALRLGWRPPAEPGAFDLLPWVVETAGEEPRQVPVPGRLVLEVPITHPEYGWFAELGLRWHAVPVISHMRLHIGGINYSAAPFNGFYLGDEIASRNLADNDRYDQVTRVARGMGLNLGSERDLWRDRAVIELNRAVLHSFDLAGVSIADHHTEARHFMRFASMSPMPDVARTPTGPGSTRIRCHRRRQRSTATGTALRSSRTSGSTTKPGAGVAVIWAARHSARPEPERSQR